MSKFRRRLMMASKVKPYDAEVEYIESTGTQYIDTGINFRNPIVTEIEMEVTKIPSSNMCIYGALLDSATIPKTQVYISNGNQWKCGTATYLTVYGAVSNATCTLNNRYNIIVDSRSSQASDLSAYLFARNHGGTSPLVFDGLRIYAVKMMAGGILLRDFIPVRKNGVGYLWDKVSKQLFGNNGSGNFVVGSDKVMYDYDAEIDYLEGDGSAYIDTGVDLSKQIVATIELMDTLSSDSARFVFGAYFDNASSPKFQWYLLSQKFMCSNTLVGTSSGSDYILNQKYVIGCSVAQQSSSAKTYLFARNNDRFLEPAQYLRIYGARIVSNNTLVRDFIPVRVGQVGYLYDNVSKTLFGNANSTGAFLIGNDK